MEASLFTNWLILRPLLALGLTWAAIMVAVLAGWIHRRVAAYRLRASSDSPSARLGPAGTQVAPADLGPGSPPRRVPANDGEARAA
jgi:hypothetical protein